ncbi:MAG: cysteine--tRNA ligase, partial [Bradyrhizobium sp.]
YEAGGEVLFDTASMPDYGALSGRRLDEQLAGARVAVDAHKKNQADFVLWKQSSADEPGWESPWGRGRPGWHIECSAMSAAYLGDVFDIHGGGLDLIFPHHENEIAQSRCAHGTPAMANIWMHNGFLQVEGEKMAKSTGNFVTIRDLLNNGSFGGNRWHGYVLRLAMLMTHYRQPVDWTVNRLVDARRTLKDWIDVAIGFDQGDRALPTELIEALSDDLNSAAAIAALHGLHREARGGLNAAAATQLNVALRFLGLWNGEKSGEVYSYGMVAGDGPSEIEVRSLIEARSAARARKDFKESDRIRDELAAMGVVIKDSKEGTTWEIAR